MILASEEYLEWGNKIASYKRQVVSLKLQAASEVGIIILMNLETLALKSIFAAYRKLILSILPILLIRGFNPGSNHGSNHG